jgi:hypothetical protein
VALAALVAVGLPIVHTQDAAGTLNRERDLVGGGWDHLALRIVMKPSAESQSIGCLVAWLLAKRKFAKVPGAIWEVFENNLLRK